MSRRFGGIGSSDSKFDKWMDKWLNKCLDDEHARWLILLPTAGLLWLAWHFCRPLLIK